MGCCQGRGTERVARKAGRHRGSARSPFLRPAAVTAASARAASPRWWACPRLGPGHPEAAADSKARAPALRRAEPERALVVRGLGDLGEKGRRGAARRSRCSRRWGRGPSALQGTSALASRQEGIFPKRNRFVRTLVRWHSYATEKPQPCPARSAEDPTSRAAPGAPLPRGRLPGAGRALPYPKRNPKCSSQPQ